MERSPERNGVLKICEELGIGFVPWAPVGMVAPETVLYFSFRVQPTISLKCEWFFP